jgi:GH24 family phage-related lysozyme (muramidase)
MRAVDSDGITFIDHAEGSVSKTYLDQAGRLTGGTGHLLTADEAKQYPLGTEVPSEVRDQWLRDDLTVAETRLTTMIGDSIALLLLPHQYDALISFVYNVGANSSWTIWKVIKAKKFDQVPAQLLRFDMITDPKTGKKVVSKGLLARRTAEKTLWLSADVDTAVACAQACPLENPSSYTRDIALTPPETLALPAHFIASGVAKAGTVVGGVGSAAAQVQAQIAPHADVAPVFHTALTICVGVTVVCGVAGLAIHQMQAKAAAS